MRYHLRQPREAITSDLRALVESHGWRLWTWTLGPRTRMRLISGPLLVVPAFEVGVVDLHFTGELRGRERVTLVEPRPRKIWRWWTVSVRACAGLVAIVIDLPQASMRDDSSGLGRGVERSHVRQSADRQRLELLVAEYLREHDLGCAGDDPYRG